MSSLMWAVGASLCVSLISFVGIITLLLKERMLKELLILVISFSAGSLMGGAFFHLLPEAAESGTINANVFLIVGFIVFLLIERYFAWHHCRDGKCYIHPVGYLNLIGDGVHNFMDGLVIGSSFVIDFRLGFVTTLIIVFHEIPQEIGDFGVLVYSGISKGRALFFNFLSGLTAVIGAAAGCYFSHAITVFSPAILALTAGGFIYIAGCDLIPEIHKETHAQKSILSILLFITGIIFMFALTFIDHAH